MIRSACDAFQGFLQSLRRYCAKPQADRGSIGGAGGAKRRITLLTFGGVFLGHLVSRSLHTYHNLAPALYEAVLKRRTDLQQVAKSTDMPQPNLLGTASPPC